MGWLFRPYWVVLVLAGLTHKSKSWPAVVWGSHILGWLGFPPSSPRVPPAGWPRHILLADVREQRGHTVLFTLVCSHSAHIPWARGSHCSLVRGTREMVWRQGEMNWGLYCHSFVMVTAERFWKRSFCCSNKASLLVSGFFPEAALKGGKVQQYATWSQAL